MLNKLARKRITIVVATRKDKPVDPVDVVLAIAPVNKPGDGYVEVQIPKPRPEGLVHRFEMQVGNLEDLLTDPIPGDYIPPNN